MCNLTISIFYHKFYHKLYHKLLPQNHYHNGGGGVNIYYDTHFCSNPTMFQFYHKFYHKPLSLSPPPPTHTHTLPPQWFLYLRQTGDSFERPAKIWRGLQIFGDNLRGEGGVWTIWFVSLININL